MTRVEAFNQLCDRMKAPANTQQYERWQECPTKEDNLIRLHHDHVEHYLKAIEIEAAPRQREFLELSCDAGLMAFKKLLDENHWK